MIQGHGLDLCRLRESKWTYSTNFSGLVPIHFFRFSSPINNPTFSLPSPLVSCVTSAAPSCSLFFSRSRTSTIAAAHTGGGRDPVAAVARTSAASRGRRQRVSGKHDPFVSHFSKVDSPFAPKSRSSVQCPRFVLYLVTVSHLEIGLIC